MQRTRVRSPIWEDPTSFGAIKPVCPEAHALQQEKLPPEAARAPQLESRPLSPQVEKAHTQQKRPRAAIDKYF